MRGGVIVQKSPRGELTNREIQEVLQAMKQSGIHAEYGYHTGLLPGDRKDFLTLRPKNQDLDDFLEELDAMLKSHFGGKYKVSGHKCVLSPTEDSTL